MSKKKRLGDPCHCLAAQKVGTMRGGVPAMQLKADPNCSRCGGKGTQ
jgi:hypothetical protein